MQSVERMSEAMSAICEAVADFARAFCDWVIEFAKMLPLCDFSVITTAYAAATKEHSEWVHKATYSKKKRIRKKYHDRIMRQYGRVDNG